jgi:hypothetical protein
MPQGVPTEDEVVAEFRARFLYSGNASAVSREMGIPERTGRKIAERLEDDPSFAEDGRKLRDRALHRHVAMRLAVCEKAAERYHDENGGIEVKRFGEDNVTIVDKRAEHGRLVLEGEKNAHSLARFDAERSGDIVPEREVIVRFERIKKKPDGET